jgi:hypothetical protein
MISTILVTLGTAAIVASSQESPGTGQPWIGKAAPPIELESILGDRESLARFAGQKFVILHFAASW